MSRDVCRAARRGAWPGSASRAVCWSSEPAGRRPTGPAHGRRYTRWSSAGQERAPPCSEHGAAVEHCRKADFSKDRDVGARLPVLGLECENPLGRTCFFAVVDLLGTAGIVYHADEMFNRVLAQEVVSASPGSPRWCQRGAHNNRNEVDTTGFGRVDQQSLDNRFFGLPLDEYADLSHNAASVWEGRPPRRFISHRVPVE